MHSPSSPLVGAAAGEDAVAEDEDVPDLALVLSTG